MKGLTGRETGKTETETKVLRGRRALLNIYDSIYE
jgi:hypothetical protein